MWIMFTIEWIKDDFSVFIKVLSKDWSLTSNIQLYDKCQKYQGFCGIAPAINTSLQLHSLILVKFSLGFELIGRWVVLTGKWNGKVQDLFEYKIIFQSFGNNVTFSHVIVKTNFKKVIKTMINLCLFVI